jgi:hypothetical protein
VGNTFTNSCKEWRDGTYDNFKDWALKQFGVAELESDDEGEVPIHMQKAKNISFTKNKRGHFMLPTPTIKGLKTAREKQRIVRGYIGAVYRE